MAALGAGLCSVTHRQLDPDAVVALAERAGLDAIEWGADVHVPPGDPEAARTLAARCESAGLARPSYGTYFFAGQHAPESLAPLLETAEALGAPLLRVWTPLGVESDAPADERARIAEALAAACETAAVAGRRLALEFHPGTLTHTAASARSLIEAVGRDDLHCYWQPESGAEPAHARAELRGVMPWLAHLHVFAWRGHPPERLGLDEGAALWKPALADAAGDAGFEGRVAYLEFVRDDDPEQLVADARSLRLWIGALA